MEKENSTLGQLPARGGEGGSHMIERGKSSLGLSQLCSATFEKRLAFGATFEQNIGLEHISSTKKSTIS